MTPRAKEIFIEKLQALPMTETLRAAVIGLFEMAEEMSGLIDSNIPDKATFFVGGCRHSDLVPDSDRLLCTLFQASPDQKIRAIKEFRSLTGCSLKEAKEAVESVLGTDSKPATFETTRQLVMGHLHECTNIGFSLQSLF